MTTTTRPGSPLDRLDRRLTHLMADHGLTALRIALGIVFFWFGVLKFFPGMSPAQDLAARTIETLTFGIVPPEIALPVLAAWECAIGLGLLLGRWMRATLLLLFVQMLGTITPLFLFPDETWIRFPIAPDARGPVHHQERRARGRRVRPRRHRPGRGAEPRAGGGNDPDHLQGELDAVRAYLEQVWGEAAARFRLTAENTAERRT